MVSHQTVTTNVQNHDQNMSIWSGLYHPLAMEQVLLLVGDHVAV